MAPHADIRVRLTPRAARDEISAGREPGSYAVRVTAPPVDGRANDALRKLIADGQAWRRRASVSSAARSRATRSSASRGSTWSRSASAWRAERARSPAAAERARSGAFTASFRANCRWRWQGEARRRKWARPPRRARESALPVSRTLGRVLVARRARRGDRRRGRGAVRQPRPGLHRARALSERVAARQGRPRPGRGRAGRQGRRNRPDGRRSGRRPHQDHGRPATARCGAGRRRSSARPRYRAWPTATSTCSSPPPTISETIPPGGVIDQTRHDDRGRPRSALQHLRPEDAQGAQRRHPRLRLRLRRQGRRGQRRLGLPQPGAGRLEPAVRRARLRHAHPQALHRHLGAAGRRPRRPPRRPRRPGRPPGHDHRRDRPPEAGALRPRSATCPASCAAPTPPSSTCARRSTTCSRWSTSPSPSRRSCGRSSASSVPLARDARPTLRDLSRLVRQPGAANDLIELTKSAVPLRDAAVGPSSATASSATAPSRPRPGAEGRRRPSSQPPPLHARPDRLVRRLQPLRALRRPRRRQPRGALRQPLRAGQRRAQPLLNPVTQSAGVQGRHLAGPALALPAARRERNAIFKPTPDFPCDASEGPPGP